MDFNPLRKEGDAFRVLLGVLGVFLLAVVIALIFQAL